MRPATDGIDAYLDRLVEELHGSGSHIRRILAETEDHLREAVAEGVARGLSPEQAAQEAIDGFGSARLVARRFASGDSRLWFPLVVQGLCSLALVAGVGLVAIGASGLVAAGLGSVAGKGFVAGDAPGVVYTPERCAEYFEYAPGASSCAGAAVVHHYDEVVGYRLDAGVLGLLVLAGHRLATRHRRRSSQTVLASGTRLPASFTPTVGVALFGASAVALLGSGLMQVAFGLTDGTGALLSGGIVSLLASVLFGVWLLRSLTGPPAGPV